MVLDTERLMHDDKSYFFDTLIACVNYKKNFNKGPQTRGLKFCSQLILHSCLQYNFALGNVIGQSIEKFIVILNDSK
jgi:hypothetical protein